MPEHSSSDPGLRDVTWLKKDDRYAEHRKIRRLTDGAYRLHDTALLACAKDETDGLVTDHDIQDMQHGPRLRKYIPELVAAGLWEVVPGGWQIHDYLHYNPSHERLELERAASRDRQMKRRQRLGDTRSTDEKTLTNAKSVVDHVSILDESPSQGDLSRRESRVSHGPVTRESQPPVPSRPVPSRPEQTTASSSTIASDPDAAPSPEVIDLCEHLATQVRRNGHHAKPGKHWHRQCRLMLDIDGRTPDQIRAAIDWATRDPFWSANIRSMATLREKYSTLQAQAQRPTPTARRTQQQETDDLFAAAAIRMGVTQPPNGHQLERATL